MVWQRVAEAPSIRARRHNAPRVGQTRKDGAHHLGGKSVAYVFTARSRDVALGDKKVYLSALSRLLATKAAGCKPFLVGHTRGKKTGRTSVTFFLNQ
jgi:hypothetical protein